MPTTLQIPARLSMLRKGRSFPDFAHNPGSLDIMRQMAQDSVSEWNTHYPPGTRVKVYAIYGEESSTFETVTTSAAWLVGDVRAVVSIEGKAGGYALTNVVPLIGQAETSPSAIVHGKEARAS